MGWKVDIAVTRDMVEMLAGVLEAKRGQMDQGAVANRAVIDQRQKMLDRLGVREGKVNRLAGIVSAQLAAHREALARMEEQIALHTRAIAFVREHTYRADAALSPFLQSGVRRLGFGVLNDKGWMT